MKTSRRIFCAVLSVCMLFLCSCGGKQSEETTSAPETTAAEVTEMQTTEMQTQQELQPTAATAAVSSEISSTGTSATESPVTESPSTAAPATEIPATETFASQESAATAVSEKQTEAATERSTESVSEIATAESVQTAYTKEQIVEAFKAAVNKTKGYTGDITVHHKETFTDMKISNVSPGGELSSRAMNFITGLIIKPSEEDYNFSGGKATTSEGEQTQLLLPTDAAFTLDASGVKSATFEKKDGLTHITLTLVSEECNSLTDIPKYNASAIGYLDIGNAFNLMKITAVKISYPGSVIDAYVRSDGYVSSVTYTVNMDCHGEATYGLISGSADFSGAQTEQWTLNW